MGLWERFLRRLENEFEIDRRTDKGAWAQQLKNVNAAPMSHMRPMKFFADRSAWSQQLIRTGLSPLSPMQEEE